MSRVRIDRQFGPFTWAGLSALRTVSFLKVGYLGAIGIPIAAYVFRSAQLFGLCIHLPKTLFWMYVGSIALALGHLLNEIACPYLVKKFQTLHAFRAHLAESFAYQISIHQAVKENLKESIEDQLRIDNTIPSQDHGKLSGIIADALVKAASTANPSESEEEQEVEPEIITPEQEWVKSNESLFLLRGLIVALYVVSAVIISALSVRQSWIVLMATFGSFWQ